MLLYLYMVRLGPTIVGIVRGTNALIIIIINYTYLVFAFESCPSGHNQSKDLLLKKASSKQKSVFPQIYFLLEEVTCSSC